MFIKLYIMNATPPHPTYECYTILTSIQAIISGTKNSDKKRKQEWNYTDIISVSFQY